MMVKLKSDYEKSDYEQTWFTWGDENEERGVWNVNDDEYEGELRFEREFMECSQSDKRGKSVWMERASTLPC